MTSPQPASNPHPSDRQASLALPVVPGDSAAMMGEGREARSPLSVAALAAMIDHAVLDPQLSYPELDRALATVADRNVFCVFVPTSATRHAVDFLAGTPVVVGAPIGFPHGSGSTAAKIAEVTQAIDDGAAEIDVVQQIGWLRSGLHDEVEAELREIVAAADGRVVKSILEVAYLDDDQIADASRIAERAGVDFVKTSTGFAPTGATRHALAIMRASVGPAVQVKASHGVKNLDTVLQLLDLGVTRFGMSATTTILDDLAERLERGDSTGV
jgi:deoxyribose-phosphate aldolase